SVAGTAIRGETGADAYRVFFDCLDLHVSNRKLCLRKRTGQIRKIDAAGSYSGRVSRTRQPADNRQSWGSAKRVARYRQRRKNRSCRDGNARSKGIRTILPGVVDGKNAS